MLTRRVGLNIRHYKRTKVDNRFGEQDSLEEKLNYFKDYIMEDSVLDFRLAEESKDCAEYCMMLKDICEDSVTIHLFNIDNGFISMELDDEKIEFINVVKMKKKSVLRLISQRTDVFENHIDITVTDIQEGEAVINK